VTTTLDELVRALADPAFYAYRPAAVEHVQTHISHVFLAGPYVYKLKKPVSFSFLDFSTRDLRRHFCEEEVRLNRRLAPGVYLDVLPVTRAAGDGLRLGGEGEALEHVVWMRRLPAERMLVRLLAAGGVHPAMLEDLAVRLAAFHARAPAGPAIAAAADPDALRARWEDTVGYAAPFVGRLLAAEDHEILLDFGLSFLRRHETLLRARQEAGRIRDGHGDLHAEHVCFVDAPVPAAGAHPPLPPGVYVFDCIEFSPALRYNDVASEIAFLAMDLERLGHPDLASRFTAAYVAAAADPLIEPLLPFYACYRACVRGKVEGLKSDEPEVEPAERAAAAERARADFALALRYAWRAGDPAVIACCGLSGTGKTTLAGALAAATGFPVVSSDLVRTRGRAGTGAPAAYGEGLYTEAARDATYAALSAEVETALAAGRSVIADATFLRRAHRERLAAAARRRRAPCAFVECGAAEDAVRARLESRGAGSVSDARWETYLEQRRLREPFAPEEALVTVDTGGEVAAARRAALRALWRWRQGRPPERRRPRIAGAPARSRPPSRRGRC
jgi:aminoglycoside phosphotransferase family enzyme/predicted kinase